MLISLITFCIATGENPLKCNGCVNSTGTQAIKYLTFPFFSHFVEVTAGENPLKCYGCLKCFIPASPKSSNNDDFNAIFHKIGNCTMRCSFPFFNKAKCSNERFWGPEGLV